MATGVSVDKSRTAGANHAAGNDALKDASSSWRKSSTETARYIHK